MFRVEHTNTHTHKENIWVERRSCKIVYTVTVIIWIVFSEEQYYIYTIRNVCRFPWQLCFQNNTLAVKPKTKGQTQTEWKKGYATCQ